MANKRQLKKRIAAVCGELADEFLIASIYLDGVDRETVNKILCEIALLQVNACDRVSVSFDKVKHDFAKDSNAYKKARREYYKKAYASLRKDFGEKVLEIVKAMNEAIPAEERKKLVNK